MVEYPVNQFPEVSIQKEQILDRLREPMEIGAIWYIIDCKWFRGFKYFVGILDKDRSSTASNPGPIDNSLLLDYPTSNLKAELIEHIDYIGIPSSAWNLLFEWYGLKENQSPIARKVIDVGIEPGMDLIIELYPVELCLYNSQLAKPKVHAFSQADKIGKIEEVCRKEFGVSEDQQIQLRCYYGPTQSQILGNPLKNVYQESLSKDLKILMEVKKSTEDAPPPKNRMQGTSATISKGRDASKIPRVVAPSSNRASHIMLTRHTAREGQSLLGTAEGRGPACVPGQSGLLNLGNTCFLNSVIQCLSNCMQLTQYFLNCNHKHEINRTNPLGTAGAIANSFADVISMMWSGKHATTVPHNFKIQLTHFAPQFAGCQQHDAQELLTFLLDGLHEDLNRIKDKPYQQEDDSDLEDEALAQTSWEYFLRRNDSIIVDHFHGMLKSRVVCPECEKVSIKFDTFSTLSLPLPERCDRKMVVRFVPYNQYKKIVDLTITVPKKGVIEDIVEELSKITMVKASLILIAEISKCHFHKFFSRDDPIERIEDRDKIYMYDLPADLLGEDSVIQYTVVPVVLSEWLEQPRQTHFLNTLFGIPFVILLPQGSVYYNELYDLVSKQLSRSFEGLTLANNNHANCSMEYENADGSHNGASAPMFTLTKVSTYAYEQTTVICGDENGRVEIPEFFGRYLLSVHIKKEMSLYSEPRVEVEDCTNGFHPTIKPTLENCLALFTTTEKLGENNAWHCPRCKKLQRATKKLDLWRMPNILTIHLKRFAFNEIQKGKLVTKVDFPLEGLDITHFVLSKHKKNLVYDLIGVCNHYGSLTAGHYTAHCKFHEDGQWYCFDDNSVAPIPAECVQTENAYLLFYQRRPVPRVDPEEEKVDL